MSEARPFCPECDLGVNACTCEFEGMGTEIEDPLLRWLWKPIAMPRMWFVVNLILWVAMLGLWIVRTA